MRISIPVARHLKYKIIQSPRLTISTRTDFEDLFEFYSHHEMTLILHRNFKRLEKYYSHHRLVRNMYSGYLRMRFEEDYNARVRKHGLERGIVEPEEMLWKLYTSLVFVNNACCTGSHKNKESKVLRTVLETSFKNELQRNNEYLRNKNKETEDRLLALDRCIISMNETLGLLL